MAHSTRDMQSWGLLEQSWLNPDFVPVYVRNNVDTKWNKVQFLVAVGPARTRVI